MSFGEDFLKGFLGSDSLRDYTHASKTFRSNGYELAPRYKFLFHTFFNMNFREIPGLANVFNSGADRNILSLAVKSVELPKFQFDIETKNQYNRKRLVQTKINYEPVTITLHDDGGDYVRNMWYNYYAYYYKDPNQNYWSPSRTNGVLGAEGTGAGVSGYSYNSRDIYFDNRSVTDWGYVGESYNDQTQVENPLTDGKPAFFKDITIFGFNQQKFAAYVLINPLIERFDHDTYDYAEDGGLMQNTMTIRYETVKYYEGAIAPLGTEGSKNVPGFGSVSHYDRRRSDLLRPGTVATILGQGGLIDVAGGIVSDLQSGTVGGLIGAVQKAGTAYETFKDGKLKSVAKAEAKQVLTDVLLNTVTGAVRNVQNTPTSQVSQILKSPNAGSDPATGGGVGTGTGEIPVIDLSRKYTPKAATTVPTPNPDDLGALGDVDGTFGASPFRTGRAGSTIYNDGTQYLRTNVPVQGNTAITPASTQNTNRSILQENPELRVLQQVSPDTGAAKPPTVVPAEVNITYPIGPPVKIRPIQVEGDGLDDFLGGG